MKTSLPSGAIHVKDINLWAHVGVLDSERINGQYFNLDFSIWLELDEASNYDDFSLSIDYRLGINAIQKLAIKVKCLTIETFSDKILDCLESIYGPLPIQIILTKCNPPIAGFSGEVAVERRRNFY